MDGTVQTCGIQSDLDKSANGVSLLETFRIGLPARISDQQNTATGDLP